MSDADVLIVGGGIAGASLAAELAPFLRVLLIEAEDQPGYHSTGRSAAFWDESYGGPGVQPLTTASGAWLRAPPPEVSEHGFLGDCGALYMGRAEDVALTDAYEATFGGAIALQRLDRAALERRVPGLDPRWTHGVFEASCADIDVGGVHGAFLRLARRAGAAILPSRPLQAAERRDGLWHVRTPGGTLTAATLVNAAGAWADRVAEACGVIPVGIVPYRRTVVQLRTDPAPPAVLPLVLDISGTFYFKREGSGRLWLSPHDETPSDPLDAAPEELDVAIAIDRFQGVVDWRIDAVERKWAGLRSFAPDRLPVYGFDPGEPGFFWCAGQGGFGIQTAPAAARLAASLLLGRVPDGIAEGIDPAPFSPKRFAA
ncbi:NAD(P)/FAD-dependent oxidoreductase [Sphingomonas sanxanigenens]|uniref:FAD dependent oxidoreductase domain-containing protein n=1 Tax=Sphingomonas sanxanigenens DSM 19645 = NX02 TaxID=1123269 RepID=W0A407_9SPHN|nr:FAD-dependent oxidoreductase [Sphingomonas sanxanigenens]AHE52689.1 hypothetical protein NX02_04735 [Sphingomonas sanxanigenens DSM 19645 = NX02]